MTLLTLTAILHRDRECIGIYFSNDSVLQAAIRKIPDVKWSQTKKCWYLPLSKENYARLVLAAKGTATIEKKQLHQYLTVKKTVPGIPKTFTARAAPTAPHNTQLPDTNNKKNIVAINSIAAINQHVLPAMEQMLKLKAYSSSTIKTYLGEMMRLLVIINNKAADHLTTADIKRYLQYCYEKLQLSENTLHSRMNALKFYYEQVLHKEKLFWEIPRPKKQIQNPHFFNQDEIARIIKQTSNLKHKTMLMLAYSTGMRVSEVTRLKVWQIDSKRMQIIVQQAKGKKDRIATLSPVLLVMLREYFMVYKPPKDGYLFCGELATTPYSTRSLQQVLKAAKQRAGILKPGSVHALRHSFATHLLDGGTDVTMIMKLLGHNDLKTTLRYLHVTNRDVLKIISPLDQLNLE